MKKGILVVSFGTTYKETREKNIDRVVSCIRERFPGYAVTQAFSSDRIRKILDARDHISISGISDALCEMKEQGITHLYVLPTHIIDGIENNRLRKLLEENRGLFAEVKLAKVLLYSDQDYQSAVQAVSEELTVEEEETVIFMGHGTSHEADVCYARLEECFRRLTGRDVYVATVEGSVTIEMVLERMRQNGRKNGRVLLAPFMLVAGDHAVNDMAGEEDSFMALLKKEGYETEAVLRGLGEYEGIRRLYIRHLEDILD